MNTPLAVIASVISVLALYLPTRTQTFTWVDVDGRNIRMLVAGQGDTTVVFETGAGGLLEHWGKVQPDVSTFARTVSYDRAGELGLSDEGPPPRDGRRIATELRGALRAAGIAPPFIVVGASLGGPYVRIFADMYPDDVKAIVLVDPTPDSDLKAWPDTLEQARASRVPVGVPVLLIDAISPREIPFATNAVRTLRMSHLANWEGESLEYKEWLHTIPDGRLVVADSGHNVPQERPEIVIATIRAAVGETARRSDR